MRFRFAAALVGLAGLSAACSSGDEADPTPITWLTYHADIAPILNERCVSCHQAGGAAPFALDSYEAAKSYGAAARYAIVNRTMPPFPMNNDGSCQTYQHARWLSNEEIVTVGQWLDEGAKEGDPAQNPGPWEPPEGLDGTVLEVAMPAPYTPTPGTGNDDYRCFVIDPKLPVDAFVTAFEVLPGNAATVHHMLLFSVDPDEVVGSKGGQPVTNGGLISSYNQATGGTGWSCYGLAGDGIVPSGLPATWSPGGGVTTYPDGSGVRLNSGDLLVMQVHYNLDHGSGPDQTRVRLKTATLVLKEGFVLLNDGFLATLGDDEPATLAPGQASVEFSWETSFAELEAFVNEYYPIDLTEVEIQGIFPHMHTAGRRLSVTIEGGATPTCVADAPRYDFNYQQFYFYEEPVLFTEGTSIRVTCDYDTRDRTGPILPGYGTADEMCMVGAYVTLPL